MLAYGLEKIVCEAVEAGADGFIVPDLPVEEAQEFNLALSPGKALFPSFNRASSVDFAKDAPSSAQRDVLPLIQMLAPTTPGERMERIARHAWGFIYLVSVTGVTGDRTSLSAGLGDLIARVRAHTSLRGWGDPSPEIQTIMRGMFPKMTPFVHENF